MVHVVFIAPRFLENTNRYVRAFAELARGGEIALSLVSADPEDAIPEPLRPHVAGHYRIADVMDPAQLTQAVRALGDGVARVDRLMGVLEQLQLPMAEVRDTLGIPGIGADTARNFRDKDRMKTVLRAAGVPVARSALVHSARELERFVADVGLPVIVKPQAGLGTRDTFRIERPEALAAARPSASEPLQVEEFVRAREHTCETVTVRGAPVWRSGTRYFPTPLEVLETAWVQYCVLLPREDDDPTWRAFDPVNTAALAALFGAAGASAAGTALTHMEWFLRDDGTRLVNEVGVRPPGVHIMPLMGLAHDTDMFADWARLGALDSFTPRPRRFAAGSAFFRGQGPGTRVAGVTGVDAAVAAAGDALVELRAPKLGMARASGYEGEGWAIIRSPTTEGAKQALLGLIQNVQVRYA
jgi:hypothetical protein